MLLLNRLRCNTMLLQALNDGTVLRTLQSSTDARRANFAAMTVLGGAIIDRRAAFGARRICFLTFSQTDVPMQQKGWQQVHGALCR